MGSEILVAQPGGYSEDDDVIYTVEGDKLVAVGSGYSLAGRLGGPQDSLVVVPSFGTLDADEPDSERLQEAAARTAESDEVSS